MNILNIGSFISMAKSMQYLTYFLFINIKYNSKILYNFFLSQGMFFFDFLNNPINLFID